MNIRKIYRQIARKNGITVKEVREEMQGAILAAYQNPPRDAGVQGCVPCRGSVPTPEEVIRYAAGEVIKKQTVIKNKKYGMGDLKLKI